MSNLDFIDINKAVCQSTVGINILYLLVAAYFNVFWYGGNVYIPNLMYYQHYATSIAIGLYFLLITTKELLVALFQLGFGLLSIITSIIYISELTYGDWTASFSGTEYYPNIFTKIIKVTASNTTSYDTSYNVFVGNIAMTIIEMTLCFIFHFIFPILVMKGISTDTAPIKDRPQFKMIMSAGKVNLIRLASSWLSILITLFGIAQCFMGIYFINYGIVLLKPIANPNYLVFVFSLASIFPPLYKKKATVNLNSWESSIFGKPDEANERTYISLSELSIPRILYVIGYTFAALVALIAFIENLVWMGSNNVSGPCPAYENVYNVMSGVQTLNFLNIQNITYSNLTSGALSTSSIVTRTLDNTQSVQTFTCFDMMGDLSIFVIFFIVWILQIILCFPEKFSYDNFVYETIT